MAHGCSPLLRAIRPSTFESSVRHARRRGMDFSLQSFFGWVTGSKAPQRFGFSVPCRYSIVMPAELLPNY